jgi:hypothetical protein
MPMLPIMDLVPCCSALLSYAYHLILAHGRAHKAAMTDRLANLQRRSAGSTFARCSVAALIAILVAGALSTATVKTASAGASASLAADSAGDRMPRFETSVSTDIEDAIAAGMGR